MKKTEIKIAESDNINHEYLPVCGPDSFTKASVALLLGEDSPAIKENRAHGVQSLSGTGALRLGAEFLSHKLGRKVVYYSDPTWGMIYSVNKLLSVNFHLNSITLSRFKIENHHKVFSGAGFTDIRTYRYWNPQTRGINIEGLIEDLQNAPEGAVIILHACAHNPTGCDPTQEQWQRIADVIEVLIPFKFNDFDSLFALNFVTN